jgi:hypothetical protein
MPKYTCKKDCVEKKCNKYKQQKVTHGRYVGQYKKKEPGYWSKASKEARRNKRAMAHPDVVAAFNNH